VLSKMSLPKVSVPKVTLPSVTIPDLPVLTPSDATMAVPRLRAPWPRIPALKVSAVRDAVREGLRALLAKLTRLASSLRGARRIPPAS
jgi:hypothetical protein